MYEISREFLFDAAHFMPHMHEGHAYRQMHGHSFQVRITVQGIPDPQTGWVMDFEALDACIADIRNKLDHQTLNEIEGLATPTLENICAWLWRHLASHAPGLARIRVARPSVGQSCVLTAPPARNQ